MWRPQNHSSKHKNLTWSSLLDIWNMKFTICGKYNEKSQIFIISTSKCFHKVLKMWNIKNLNKHFETRIKVFIATLVCSSLRSPNFTTVCIIKSSITTFADALAYKCIGNQPALLSIVNNIVTYCLNNEYVINNLCKSFANIHEYFGYADLRMSHGNRFFTVTDVRIKSERWLKRFKQFTCNLQILGSNSAEFTTFSFEKALSEGYKTILKDESYII